MASARVGDRSRSPSDDESSSRASSASRSRKTIKTMRDDGGFRMKRSQLMDHKPADSLCEISIGDEVAEGAKYVVDGPLRRVTPYYFTYLTYCKERWRDRLLLDIFTTEFRDRDEAYYKQAIENGQVLVSKKVADLSTVVRNGDLISHRTHKHEQPVTSRPIRIVHEDDELLVIDKPSGIPVHPTGRFRYNSIVMVLKYEQGIIAHPCNRLDRLTSGLMFLAKTAKGADKMGMQLRDRDVRKEYLAQVAGEFPLGEIVCEEPVITADPKVALNVVRADGKEAKTVFTRVSYDGNMSIVRCRPYTGRTHQIRVHLQYLGHPIANDPLYSNLRVWGPELGKGGNADFEEVSRRLHDIGKTEVAETFVNPESDAGEKLKGEKCEVCRTDLYTDPGPNDLDLWLHAQKYYAKDGSWSYETPAPYWVTDQHLPFMQLALEEALKCEPTETAFCVGAVLVKDGKILETGYSRELPGNTHAEQCALEKYFTRTGKKDVPEGTVIYTTMEPCSERLSGNLPCVDRILATRIKTVFVGVKEPEIFVKDNTGLSQLSVHGIEYMRIPGLEDECLRAAKKGHPDQLEPQT